MKLLVCVSKAPDTTTKIVFNDDGTALNTAGVQYIMNPYDEWYALVRALELKEAAGGTVSLVNVGPADNDTVIRKGLAIGADDAFRIDTAPESAFEVASQIAHFVKEQGGFDIIFLGKETIDYNGSEVGSMLAELLEVPFISNASKMEMDGDVAVVSRDIEGGVEALALKPSFVISAAKGLAEQRIPNMRGIMMAKRKPLQVVAPQAIENPVVAVHYELPEEKGAVKLIDPENMEELVRLLHEEAKVI